jgi:ATP-dependent protease ClpP protease subunit
MNRFHPYLRLSKNNKKKSNKEQEDNNELNEINENFLTKLNPLEKINSYFNFNNDNDNVYLEDNHLYFKTDVDSDSINKLCMLIRKYTKSLKELKNNTKIANIEPKPLYIHITTYGGELYQGFLGYDYIKGASITIYTVVEGFNASAGTIMSMGGKKRYMTASSVMLIHQLRSSAGGKFDEIEEDYENCKEAMDRMKNLYLQECRGKMSKKQIAEELKHDRWWDSQKCIKYGLCDEIYTEF